MHKCTNVGKYGRNIIAVQ